MNVPLLDLKLHHDPLRKDILVALEQVITRGDFILGESVRNLESQIAEYCQVRFGIGVSSGTDALLVSLMTLGIKAGYGWLYDKILTPVERKLLSEFYSNIFNFSLSLAYDF